MRRLFIYFKSISVSSIVYRSLHLWLISKGMCVLLFDVFNRYSLVKKWTGKGMSKIYYWEKLTFSKLVGKKISRKENLKWPSFEELKGIRYIQGNIYFGIIVFSCLWSTKPCLRFLLTCFAQEIKGFYQSFLGNEVDFSDIMNVPPNILAKN